MGNVLINPSATQLGAANAVLRGRGVRYESRFAGPLSIKGVMAGSATWETSAGRFEVVPGSVLLIHENEEYIVTIDALRPVETFCFFFARGFDARFVFKPDAIGCRGSYNITSHPPGRCSMVVMP